jgi:serine/threonine-protein kinase/endoribonuclease IRE1
MPQPVEVLRQLAEGLEHIHKMGLIHRDIKPENVLICVSPETGQFLMKWADFTVSKPVNERGTCSMSGVRGTFDWLAPELLKILDDAAANEDERENTHRETIKTDVYAEGLVFGYYLTGGLHLFGSRFQIGVNILTNNPVNLSSKNIYKNVFNPINDFEIFETEIQPQYARDLIQKMLAYQPEKRITSSEVVEELIRINQTTGFRFKDKTTKLNDRTVRATIPSSNFLVSMCIFILLKLSTKE